MKTEQDLINLMEWNQFAEDRKTLLEALTILNNRHRDIVAKQNAQIIALRGALEKFNSRAAIMV